MIEASIDLKQVQSELAKLEANLRVKAVRRGLTFAAAPIKREMKEQAPDRSGTLKKAIGQQTLSGKKRDVAHTFTSAGGRSKVALNEDQQAVIIGANRKVNGFNPSYRSTLAEFGTDPHIIKPKKRSKKKLRLSFSTGLSTVFAFTNKVFHPGAKANPFMARSLSAHESNLESRFYKGLSRFLDKQKQ